MRTAFEGRAEDTDWKQDYPHGSYEVTKAIDIITRYSIYSIPNNSPSSFTSILVTSIYICKSTSIPLFSLFHLRP